MSGSLVPEIKSFVAGFLGFSLEHLTTKWKRIGMEEDVGENGYIPNSQVRFERKGGTTMTKGECFKEVIARAKVNAAAGKQHMILVLCKDDGEMVVDGLLHGEDELKEGHVLFLHSGLRRTQEISKRLEDFKNGRGELLLIISTQPVTGLDCKFLCELDVMGS